MSGTFRAVRIVKGFSVTALAAAGLLSSDLLIASDAKYRLSSIVCRYTWQDIAATIDGGLVFGIAHGDYTDTEILEFINASTSLQQGDMVANERAQRRIRIIGSIQGSDVVDGEASYNLGRPVKTKLNWEIPIGTTVSVWIHNGSATIWSIGSDFFTIGQANVWFT